MGIKRKDRALCKGGAAIGIVKTTGNQRLKVLRIPAIVDFSDPLIVVELRSYQNVFSKYFR